MTRKEIEAEYTVKNGIIQDLFGKFESEPVYAPYFYSISLDGGSEELSFQQDGCGEYAVLIEVSAEDRAEFPEIDADTAYVLLTESQQGFVGVTELTAKEADKAREDYAQEDEDEEV